MLAEALGPTDAAAARARRHRGGRAGSRPAQGPGPRARSAGRAAALLRRARRALRPGDRPGAREAGRDVVCDRFIDSTVAYQGAARKLGVEMVEGLNAIAIGGCVPDLTVLLRLDPEAGRGARPAAARGGRSGRGGPLRGRGDLLPARRRRGLRRARRSSPRADRRDRRRRRDRRGPRAGRSTAVRARPSRVSAAATDRRPGAAGADRRRRPHQPAARLALAIALQRADARLPARRPARVRQARAPPAPSPPSCWPRARRTPTMRAGGRWPTPLRTPTSSGSSRRATQHLVETVRERVIARRRLPAVRGRAPRVRDRRGRGDGGGEPERAPEDARGAGAVRPPDPAHAPEPAALLEHRPLALPADRASRRSRRRSSRSAAGPRRRRRAETAARRGRSAARGRRRAACFPSPTGAELRDAAEDCAARLAGAERRPWRACSRRPRRRRRATAEARGRRGASRRGGRGARPAAPGVHARPRRAPGVPRAGLAPRRSTWAWR